MKRKRVIGIYLIGVFSVLLIGSGGMFLKQYRDAEESKKSFSTLSEMVEENEKTRPGEHPVRTDETPGRQNENNSVAVTPEEPSDADLARERYGFLYEKNPDFVGWISIEGTRINYPVMQTPDDPGYYLKHSFEGTYSDYGVPYLDEACVPGESSNLVIYGHNMSNGTMFHDLGKYMDEEFCRSHPVILFDTLDSFGDYEIIAVFRYDADRDDFRYDKAVSMDEEAFASFLREIRARQIYDTGTEAVYGDRLLTLSTCEYTFENGRLVVVARKKA